MARLWQRTKSGFTAPAQYIQTTDSVSRPMAVMMSLVMLFVALAIIVALFFAGKWAYDQIANKNSKPANPVTGITSEGTTAPKPADTNASSSASGNTATVTSNGSGSAVVTTNQPTASSSTSNASQPASSSTGTATTSVPNTGTGSMLGVFAIAFTIGTLGYRTVLIRKLR